VGLLADQEPLALPGAETDGSRLDKILPEEVSIVLGQRTSSQLLQQAKNKLRYRITGTGPGFAQAVTTQRGMRWQTPWCELVFGGIGGVLAGYRDGTFAIRSTATTEAA
jgi:hypothetical protein